MNTLNQNTQMLLPVRYYHSKDIVMWSKETKLLKCDEWLLVNWAIVSDNLCAFSFSCQLLSETFI